MPINKFCCKCGRKNNRDIKNYKGARRRFERTCWDKIETERGIMNMCNLPFDIKNYFNFKFQSDKKIETDDAMRDVEYNNYMTALFNADKN